MVGACQLRLQCITNAGWEGQEEDKTDTKGSHTSGILFAASIAPAACIPVPLHVVSFLLQQQATSEEEVYVCHEYAGHLCPTCSLQDNESDSADKDKSTEQEVC